MIDELLNMVSGSPELLRRRVQSEIERLVERGFIETAEADELKARFLTEIQKQSERGKTLAAGLGSIGKGMQAGLAAMVRETLDLPSATELRSCLSELEELVKKSRSQPKSGPCDAPLLTPGHRDDPGSCFEVLPGVITWSRFQEDRGLYFNSYSFEHAGSRWVIDPVDPGTDKARNQILELAPIDWIVITNRNHVRATDWLRTATKAKVLAHSAEVFEQCEIDRRVESGEEIAEGLRVIGLAGKTPGEFAVHRQIDGGQLFVGDAIIGDPAGSLALLPETKLEDPRQLRCSLRNLLEEEFETLFLCDGVSILADASLWTHKFLRTI